MAHFEEETEEVKEMYHKKEQEKTEQKFKQAKNASQQRKTMLEDRKAQFNADLFTRLTSIVIEQEIMDHQAQSRVNELMTTQRGWVLGVISDVEKCSQVAKSKLEEVE